MSRGFSVPASLVLLAAAGCLLPPQPAWPQPAAGVDGLDFARHQALGAALQWSPVNAGGPFWAGGTVPAHVGWGGGTSLELGPRDETRVRLPAHGWLRIEALDGTMQPPRVELSFGTGVAIAQALVPGADGHSWLLRTALPQPVVAHVSGDGQATRRLALFVGRHEPAPSPVIYGDALALPAPTVAVRPADQATAQPHARLSPGQPVEFEAVGPGRLMLEARIEAVQPAEQPLLTLSAQLGGEPLALARAPSGPDSGAPVQVDGEWRPAGRNERFWLEVPPGRHRLGLDFSHPVLARVRPLREPDLLLPKINRPPVWSHLAPDASVEALQRDAAALVASNAYRDAGVLAAAALDQAAQREPGQPQLRSVADELEASGGQWLELPPASGAAAGSVQAAATLALVPQPPAQAPRIAPLDPRTPLAELPAELFHAAGADGLRYRPPASQRPMRLRLRVLDPGGRPALLELRDDAGRSWLVRVGVARLPEQLLRPDPAALAALPQHPTELPGRTAAPLRPSGDAQWWLPPGVTGLTLRALEGQAHVALAWRGSGDVPLDDAATAALAKAEAADGSPLAVRAREAWQPLRRLAEAALAQLSAGVHPLQRPVAVDEVAAARAADAARAETDPVLAFEAWTRASRSLDPLVQAAALRGQAQALRAAGERYLAEQWLRAHWLSGDAALSGAARTELDTLYAQDGDTDAQLQLAAAAVARGDAGVEKFSAVLAAEGEDRLALTAALAGPRPVNVAMRPQLLAAALRAGQPATFEALLAGVQDPAEAAFWRAQRALQAGDVELALRELAVAGQPQWAAAVREAQRLAAAQAPGAAPVGREVVDAWLQWQWSHPGPRLWRTEPAALAGHGGGITLRSVARNLRSTWWRAGAQAPLVLRVVGPVRLRLEARPLHQDAQALADGWLRVEGGGQRWVQPFEQNRPSPGLVSDTPGVGMPGERIVRDIDVPAGFYRLEIHAGDVPVAVRFAMERPALQIPLLPAPTVAHFEPGLFQLGERRADAGCGNGCLVGTVRGRLDAFDVVLRDRPWPGLPLPTAGSDPAAARLASGDVAGAVELAATQAEKMRLLAWLAETQPQQRARALALGAALRGPLADADTLAAWQRLSATSQWSLLPLLERSAGLRAMPVAAGAPELPAARLRAALLGPLGEDEVRLSGDTRATLLVADPAPADVEVHLSAEDLPALQPLPLVVEVKVNGRPARRVTLPRPGSRLRVPLRLPAGEHEVSVAMVERWANQSLRVRFGGSSVPLPQLTRDWQIATPAQPVRLVVAGPAWLRVDALGSDGRTRSEERFVAQGMQTLALAAQPGQAETLYRVYQRRVEPNTPPAPRPRPPAYQPTPMPDAPRRWHEGVVLGEPPRAVRFRDATPPNRLLDYTWTPRVSLQSRRDTEASGGTGAARQERFTEFGLAWQRRSDDGQQWRLGEGFVRLPDSGSPVLGFELGQALSVHWLPALPMPLDFSISLSGAAQGTPLGWAAGLRARAALAQTRQWSQTLAHRPEVAAFLRHSTLDDVSDEQLARIDSDVYTRYRQRHRFGVELSDTLSWQPWRDTELALRGRVVSNENLSPDHLRAELRWRQMAGPWRLEAGWRHTRYRADRDRAAAVSMTEPYAALRWEHWLADGRRLELRVGVRRDSLSGSVSGGVELLWHQSQGRGLWDLGPSERDFQDLREWRRPRAQHEVEELR